MHDYLNSNGSLCVRKICDFLAFFYANLLILGESAIYFSLQLCSTIIGKKLKLYTFKYLLFTQQNDSHEC